MKDTEKYDTHSITEPAPTSSEGVTPSDDSAAGRHNEPAPTSSEGRDSNDDRLRIDVGAVIRDKLGPKARYAPKWLVRCVERIICQNELNEMLERTRGLRDAEFCRGVLRHWDIRLKINNPEGMPAANKRRVVLVSNHPLGGLDGLALIDLLSSHFGGKVWFVVNDLLMAVKPLRGVFLPINKHGGQSRASTTAIDDAFEGDDPVIIFPAGLVSRLVEDKQISEKGKVVADLDWQKMFVNKAVKHQRDVIPMHFDGENSSFFYKFANLRKRIGLKFNIEMVLLPREMLLCKGREFGVTFGETIAWQSLEAGKGAGRCAARIRRLVYELKKRHQ